MAFINPDCFYQVIVPLLGVSNTALLGITTPQDRFNYFSLLINLKDAHGNDLFYVIKIGLVCQACEKTGTACPHLLHLNPLVIHHTQFVGERKYT